MIAFAFSDLDPAAGNLERFIGSTWREKWRDIVGLRDPEAKRCYDALVALADDVRNPASHGGLDHQRNLIHFHLPGLGVAVPVQMSRVGAPDHFRFAQPVEDRTIKSAAKISVKNQSRRVAPLLSEAGWRRTGGEIPRRRVEPVGSVSPYKTR